MAISTDGKYISKKSNDGLSIANVARCLTRSTLDLGQLCGDVYWDEDANNEQGAFLRVGRVRAMALNKPEKLAGLVSPTFNQRLGAGFSINKDSVDTEYNVSDSDTVGPTSYATMSTKQATYTPPTGGINAYPYRLLDFDGYYHGAPAFGMTCAVNSTINYNIIAGASETNNVNFYAYFKAALWNGSASPFGSLANREFSATDGFNLNSTKVPTTAVEGITYSEKVIGMEDIIAGLLTDTSSDITGKTGTFFGVLLYKEVTVNNTTQIQFQRFCRCNLKLNYQSNIGPQMYQLPVCGDNRGIFQKSVIAKKPETGTYHCIPVMRTNSEVGFVTDYPMFRNNGYGVPFTLNVGGQSDYAYRIFAIGQNTDIMDEHGPGQDPTRDPIDYIQPTQSTSSAYQTVYVRALFKSRDYNDVTTISHSTAVANFKLRTHIDCESLGIDRYLDANECTLYAPSGDIVVPSAYSGTPVDLYFQLEHIWYVDGQEVVVSPNTQMTMTCEVYYDGATIERNWDNSANWVIQIYVTHP